MLQLSKTSVHAILIFMFAATAADSVCGQTDRRRRDDSPTVRALESRVEKAEESLVGEYREVATEFYKQGDREKSLALLQRLSSLDPQMAGLKDQIKKIQDELLEENPGELSFDTRKQVWLPIGRVQKGKVVLLQCTGDYKLTLSGTLTAAGMQKIPAQTSAAPPKRRGTADRGAPDRGQKAKRTQEDVSFIERLPLGCLVGVIVDGTDLGEPFRIGESTSLNPKSDGILIVKTNLPPSSRCVGKLDIVFSGYIDTDIKK